jgi:hypothetical protein
MKTCLSIAAGFLVTGLCITSALANPALLPKHPGYPAERGVSPVTGQSLANDSGQPSTGGEKALIQAAASEDSHAVQNLTDPNNERIVKKEGAGRLPKVDGPQIKIEPPVDEAARAK